MQSILTTILFFFGIQSGATFAASKPVLGVLTYDSIVAKKGLGAEIKTRFESRCGCDLKLISGGDAAQALTRAELDSKRGKLAYSVVLGIDQMLWERAKPLAENWGEWRPNGWEQLEDETTFEPGFAPLDYGAMAWMADSKKLAELGIQAPARLSDLLKPEYQRKLLLEDPRASTPGLGFLLFVRETKGKDWTGFFRKLRSQWLTLAPGWDAAYGAFLKEEAPLVWSYVTSQAYHAAHGDKETRYKAVVFEDGNPLQIEGAFILKNAPQSALARDFISFLISEEAQSLIPTRQWMMPARKGISLPDSFKGLPTVKKKLVLRPKAGEAKEALKQWDSAL